MDPRLLAGDGQTIDQDAGAAECGFARGHGQLAVVSQSFDVLQHLVEIACPSIILLSFPFSKAKKEEDTRSSSFIKKYTIIRLPDASVPRQYRSAPKAGQQHRNGPLLQWVRKWDGADPACE